MTGKIKVIGAVVDTTQLILYKQDGERVYIPQGDPRIRGIIDYAMPILNAGGVAEISLEMANEYAAFEKKTNGLVRLFRVAKKAVAHLFGSDEEREELVQPMEAGAVPTAEKPRGTAPTAATIDEIMANATPVTSDKFQESETKAEEHTMVAVVGTGSQAKVVPGVEALKGQMAHANKLGSTKGVEALITRLSKVIETRGHSVQDVLRFLERGDLPVADDGSIIAYKILSTRSSNPDFKAREGLYFDCHTHRVPQQIGSYVCVDESLVDRNRCNECSNGLHIARRAYLGQFSGDACVLIKLAPEDVVTVPHNDPNKVRVCGYHIIGLIPDSEFRKLRANQPMTENSDCRKLLEQALTGQHVDKLEQVKITQQAGGGIVVTPLAGGKKKPDQAKVETVKAPEAKTVVQAPNKTIAPTARALDDQTLAATSVDPKAVSQKVQEQKAQPSRQQLAAELVTHMNNGDLSVSERKNAAEALVALKKRTKVSYLALGLTPAQVTTLEKTLKGDIAQKAEQAALLKPKLKPQPEPELPKSTTVPMSRTQMAAHLVKTMNTGINVHPQMNAAKELVELKKKSRQSWASLGVSDKDAKTALDLSDTKTITSTPPVPTPAPKASEPVKAQPKPTKKTSKKKEKRHTPKAVIAAPTPVVVSPPATPKDGPRRIEAKRLYAEMSSKTPSLVVRKIAATNLKAHKQRSKVSWTALGLPKDMSKQIEELLATK